MDKPQAIYSFWSSFKIPAYEENSVPKEEDRIDQNGAAFPYIAYDIVRSDFNHEVAMSAKLWYRSTNRKSIEEKTDEIEYTLGRGGVQIPFDGGTAWIKKADPFAQPISDTDDKSIKGMLINISVDYNSEY